MGVKMKRIDFLELITQLFEFKIITDEHNHEFVLLKTNPLKSASKIDDKTQFEAVENHVHLLEHIKSFEFKKLEPIAVSLGQALLWSLHASYPDKHFVVFVTVHLHDSMIIRFHQKWAGESFYYDMTDFQLQNEKIYLFEN